MGVRRHFDGGDGAASVDDPQRHHEIERLEGAEGNALPDRPVGEPGETVCVGRDEDALSRRERVREMSIRGLVIEIGHDRHVRVEFGRPIHGRRTGSLPIERVGRERDVGLVWKCDRMGPLRHRHRPIRERNEGGVCLD